MIDPDRRRIDDRNDPKHARPAQGLKLAQAQHDRFFPLLGHLDREQEVSAQQAYDNYPGRDDPLAILASSMRMAPMIAAT